MIYKIQARKNPMNREEVRYYPVIALNQEPLTLEAIISEIVDATGVTRPDVKSVIAALEQRIIAAMRDGRSFRLGDLGSFRPTISGNGMATPEEVNASCIKYVRVQFSPSGYMERKLKPGAEGVTFTKQSSDTEKSADDEATA